MLVTTYSTGKNCIYFTVVITKPTPLWLLDKASGSTCYLVNYKEFRPVRCGGIIEKDLGDLNFDDVEYLDQLLEFFKYKGHGQ